MNKVNNRLYFYENYFQSLNNLLTFKNLPQSIIFSGQAGLGKKTFLLHFFAFHLLNSSKKETYLKEFTIHDQEILKRLSNNEYANFKIVKKKEKNSSIQIDQIRELINFCSYKASFSSPRFILILNIEDLNLDKQLLDKINKFAPIKHILKNKLDNDDQVIELLDDISKDLFNYDLEFRIQELESRFSKDMSETTFNELKELKNERKIN